MITLLGCAHFFNFVSFLLYPTDVKRLKCAMLGAFTVLMKCICILRAARAHNSVSFRLSLPYTKYNSKKIEVSKNTVC